MHLSKSRDRTRRPSPPPKTRRQPGCPAPQPKPSAVISAPDRIGPAAAVRGSRAGEPSCQPAPPAPQRPDRPTLQNIKDSERPIQSPGSAPLPQQSRRPPEPRPSQKLVSAAPSVRRRLRARKRGVNRKSATAPVRRFQECATRTAQVPDAPSCGGTFARMSHLIVGNRVIGPALVEHSASL